MLAAEVTRIGYTTYEGILLFMSIEAEPSVSGKGLELLWKLTEITQRNIELTSIPAIQHKQAISTAYQITKKLLVKEVPKVVGSLLIINLEYTIKIFWNTAKIVIEEYDI